MKKIAATVIISSLCVFLFCAVGGREELRLDERCLSAIRTAIDGGGTKNSADAENVETALYEANVKMSDKYIVSKILTKIENDGSGAYAAYAKNKLSRASSNPDVLLRAFKELYREGRIIKIESDCNALTSPDLSIPKALITPRLSERRFVGADGATWIVGKNYFVKYEDDTPSLIVRSTKGMARCHSFPDPSSVSSCRELFESTKASCVGNGSCEGELMSVSVSDRFKGYGELFYVFCKTYSDPVLVDFSSFEKNRRAAY